MSVTLKDIANEVHISVTAVSQVLNNRDCRISEEKRKLIFDTAKKMNYHPNQNAVALATRKTWNIAVVIYDISNSFFATMAQGIDDVAVENGYQIMLVNMVNKNGLRNDYSKILAFDTTDALIMTCDQFEPGLQELLKRYSITNKPIVGAGVTTDLLKSGNVIFDNNQGGYLATKYLLEHNHSRIACITGPHFTPISRLQGYRRALAEFGADYDAQLIREGDYHTEQTRKIVRDFLDRGIDSFFTFNDLMAYAVYEECQGRGLKVGQDISVVGYDDIAFSKLLDVPLTTIRQPAYEMGKAAAGMAIEMIDSHNLRSKDVYFKAELIERESVKL